MMQCPYEECGRRFIVPWEKKDELMKCPFCLQSVFADRIGLVHIEEGVTSERLPPIIPAYKTSKLELLCVGNVGSGYIHAQVRVMWYEPEPDEVSRTLVMKGKHLPIRNFYRKARINYCWFDVPEGYVCWYFRHAQTKPDVQETRCFYLSDGQYYDLGEVVGGLILEVVQRFYPQYRKWAITISG